MTSSSVSSGNDRGDAPRVSVIIAAYNSSARLRCAVETVRRQSISDFEVVVIGDCCTDDSEDTLRAFSDSRIRWENLPQNWGEQSVASNRGIDLARGRFIFFLNQDDLWCDDHVEASLNLLEKEGLDMVWSPFLDLPPGYRAGTEGDSRPWLGGKSPDFPRFNPLNFVPASCTAWRSSALRRIGGWRTAAEVEVSPSQDLLWRAKRAGLLMRGKEPATVLVLWSGHRPGSYRPSFRGEDNEYWLGVLASQPERVRREAEIADAVSALAGDSRKSTFSLRRLGGRILRTLSRALGLHPMHLKTWLIHRSEGGLINHVRAKNDLGRLDFRAARPRRRS